jgi:hypothetical protein
MVHMRRLGSFADLVDRVERPAAGARAGLRVAAKRRAGEPRRSRRFRPSRRRPPPPPCPPPSPGPADGAAGSRVAMILAAARPSLAQPLRGARARLDDDMLTLEVGADFSTFASMHGDDYRELARKAAGRALKVQVNAAAAAEADTPPAPAEVKKRRLIEEASREPAVQEALDLFGGKVVEVRESKP